MAHNIVLPAVFPISDYLVEFGRPGTITLRTCRPEGWETHVYDLTQGAVRISVAAGNFILEPKGVFTEPDSIVLDMGDPTAEVTLLRHLSTGDIEIIGADDLSYECVGGSLPQTEFHRFLLSACPVELRLDHSDGVPLLHITFNRPPNQATTGYTRLSAVQ